MNGADKVIYSGPNGKWGFRICFIAGVIAVGAAIFSLHYAYVAWTCWQVEKIYPWLIGWMIGTPVWFWIEYFVVFRKFGNSDAFDSFKHGQQLSLAIWAGLALFLNGLIGSEHFKGVHESSVCCESQQTAASCNSAKH